MAVRPWLQAPEQYPAVWKDYQLQTDWLSPLKESFHTGCLVSLTPCHMGSSRIKIASGPTANGEEEPGNLMEIAGILECEGSAQARQFNVRGCVVCE